VPCCQALLDVNRKYLSLLYGSSGVIIVLPTVLTTKQE
jgi:hypothetical protein